MIESHYIEGRRSGFRFKSIFFQHQSRAKSQFALVKILSDAIIFSTTPPNYQTTHARQKPFIYMTGSLHNILKKIVFTCFCISIQTIPSPPPKIFVQHPPSTIQPMTPSSHGINNGINFRFRHAINHRGHNLHAQSPASRTKNHTQDSL